jgi:threonine/homoserine/homoserine lactone efflux protein
MSPELLLPLISFAFVMSVTPGPNNLMLMASGANFGFRRTIPHMLGIAIGFTVMTLMLGVGLVGLFHAFPVAYTLLKVASVVYMLWLAWRIAHSAAPGQGAASGKPMTFLQAAAFQWVNPKAWAMALGALTAYAPDQSLTAVAVVACVFGAVNLPTVSIWAVAGQSVRRFLTGPGRLQAFNWTMAGLLMASLYPVLMH